MANTTIELKYSQIAANVPSTLANGEIAINTNDGILFYKDQTDTIQQFNKYPGPAGITGDIQLNISGQLAASGNLSHNVSTGNTSTLALHTRSWIQWADGTKQYTANAGGAGGTIAAVDIKTYTATAAQTTFAITYTSPYVLVTVNGVVLDQNEYTATSNTNIVLTTPATANDLVHLMGFAGNTITVIADDLDQFARNQANAAFDKANTDVTNISTSATVYGNTTYTTQINLAANGRINGITNTAIAFPVTTVSGATGTIANSTILTGLLTVDGAGSTLDADYLDGKHGSEYANTLHTQAAYNQANTASVKTINFLIDGGGSVITTGSKGNVSIDFSGTITNWKIFNDVSGNMTVDISRSNLTNFGTFTSSGGSSPSTVGQLANSSFALNWTGFTTIAANDVLQFSVSGTPTNATKSTVSLRVVS